MVRISAWHQQSTTRRKNFEMGSCSRVRSVLSYTQLHLTCRVIGAIQRAMARMNCSLGKKIAMGAVVAASLWLCGAPASAGNVCVSCDGPPAVYSCSYAPDATGQTPNRSARSMQFVCIQDVARQYQHSSCKVNRNQLGPCNGQVHMIPQNAAATPPQNATNNEVTTQTPVPAIVPKKKREPPTVIEMAKRTAASTNKQIKKSARKVSKAAKSTWRCVTTLFSKC